MNTVMVTTLARPPPARFMIASICENTCFTCASKLFAMSFPWLSRVAVWPATQTILPPSVITPGEKARESWKGVFSMYSAAWPAMGSASSNAAMAFLMFGSVSFGRVLHPMKLVQRPVQHRREHHAHGHDDHEPAVKRIKAGKELPRRRRRDVDRAHAAE